jgi:hypothetical protein
MYIFEEFRECNYNYGRKGCVSSNFRGDTVESGTFRVEIRP